MRLRIVSVVVEHFVMVVANRRNHHAFMTYGLAVPKLCPCRPEGCWFGTAIEVGLN